MPPATTDDKIAQSGFALMPGVMDDPERQTLLAALGEIAGAGRRGLLGLPAVAVLARSERWLELARPHLPAEPRAVRAIYFYKSAEAN